MEAETDAMPSAEAVVAPPQAFARVLGEPLLKLPEDLYIPPDALEVFLDAFEGPLDLLLYLIRRQNLDNLRPLEMTRMGSSNTSGSCTSRLYGW